MRFPIIALAYLLLYALGALLLREQPLARSIFGNVGLLIPPIAVAVVVWKRRLEWQGCQRLFWDAVAIGAGLWVIGHLGWAFEEFVLGSGGWLRWHTLFSLCGGVFPLIALLARPHLGTRNESVTGVGPLLASYGTLVVFLHSYFVLVPSLVLPRNEAESALFLLVQINRGALAAGFIAVAWRTRHTAWGRTFGYMAMGVTSGFFLRLITSQAIAAGSYQAGTLFDLAWIAPFASYALGALTAPRSPDFEDATLGPGRLLRAPWAAVPVVLIPVIGYGALWLQPLGGNADAFRALITALLTVAGLGFLTLRLSLQAGELKRSDSRLRLLAAATEQTQDMILITRADGRIEHANDAFVRALGYSREDLSRRSFEELLEEGFDGVGRHIREDLRARGVWRGTLLRRRRDGSTFPAACTITSLKEGAAITYLVGVERDITEELRLQDQLVHTERLSAIGELVAGVAHEINNPLQTVVGSVELMLEDRSSPPAIRRDLEVVRREAGRAAQIVRSLLAFVRGGTPERTALDVNQVVREAVGLRQFQFQQKSVGLSVDLTPLPAMVLGSREELQQIVMNLLVNAEQAVDKDGNGAVTIRTALQRGVCTLEVADNGGGVDEELRGRIFEPFFTTKPVGEGTGLGLSISHGIASAHGGTLELIPSDRGALFRLTLPVHDYSPASAPRTDVSVHDSELTSGAGLPSALVVDDEPAIRSLIVRLLKKREFDVMEAGSGEDAIAMLRDRDVAVVLCDIRMPGMTGFELYQRVSSAGKRVPPFIFMTGDRGAAEHAVHGAAVLAKPFTAADLDRALEVSSVSR